MTAGTLNWALNEQLNLCNKDAFGNERFVEENVITFHPLLKNQARRHQVPIICISQTFSQNKSIGKQALIHLHPTLRVQSQLLHLLLFFCN